VKIEILDEAERDLVEGFRFYESQATGLGDYFLDSFTPGTSIITASSPNGSHSPFTTRLSGRPPELRPCWIADAIRLGLRNGCGDVFLGEPLYRPFPKK